MPLVLKAVFPIGDHYFSVPFGRPDTAVKTGHKYRDEVVKRAGSPVPTTAFETNPTARKSLAGVFFSVWPIWNAPARTGKDIVFVHNPFMPNRVPEGAFAFTGDEWVPGPEGTIMPRSLRPAAQQAAPTA